MVWLGTSSPSSTASCLPPRCAPPRGRAPAPALAAGPALAISPELSPSCQALPEPSRYSHCLLAFCFPNKFWLSRTLAKAGVPSWAHGEGGQGGTAPLDPSRAMGTGRGQQSPCHSCTPTSKTAIVGREKLGASKDGHSRTFRVSSATPGGDTRGHPTSCNAPATSHGCHCPWCPGEQLQEQQMSASSSKPLSLSVATCPGTAWGQ